MLHMKPYGDERGREATRGSAIDFLGYAFDQDKVFLRKRIKQTFARKMARLKSKRRRHDVLASYWGWCKWGNCRHLWNVLTDCDMSFADNGISGRNVTRDGQEFYDLMTVKADDIINVPITVVSFITGVSTSQGPDRYVVKLAVNGRECKWITNSVTIKSMLDQAKEKDVLPQETVLRKRDLGNGRKDYIFD